MDMVAPQYGGTLGLTCQPLGTAIFMDRLRGSDEPYLKYLVVTGPVARKSGAEKSKGWCNLKC